ncbi:MAG: DapH/DapD/GlmU-related protein [Thiobacillus sp.]|nr:DapH/DapD/GlmU-related protein [Thiobacillus sp.]
MRESIVHFVFQDWHANAGNSKGRFVLPAYRLAAWFTTRGGMLGLLGKPYCAIYRVVFAWILGIELPLRSRVGAGLKLFHGQGLVVHELVEIGSGVVLRHGTTIGAKAENTHVPRIGNGVDIGSNSVILGDIHLGDGCVVGAGSVVTKSVLPYSVVAGNPAKVLHTSISGSSVSADA